MIAKKPTDPRHSPHLPSSLQKRTARAGRFAWAVLVHFAVALLLGTSAIHPARRLAAGAEPGVRPRDGVELALVHRRDGAPDQLAPRLRRTPQPPRAGTDAAPFLSPAPPELPRGEIGSAPSDAPDGDPRSARRPAYYANAPPIHGDVTR